MRKVFTWTLASTAVLVVACGRSKSPTGTAMSVDLKRDLQLAAATQAISINPDEISPVSKNDIALRPRKAPDGPKVIRSEHPTVKASAKPVEAAEVKTEMPQVQVLASSPAPSESPTPDAPPLARPAPVPTENYPSTGNAPTSGNGPNRGGGNGGMGGIGGIFGGIFGGIGDDDHCEPRGGARRGGGRPIGGMGGVYGGRPGVPPIGGIIVIGGRRR